MGAGPRRSQFLQFIAMCRRRRPLLSRDDSRAVLGVEAWEEEGAPTGGAEDGYVANQNGELMETGAQN